MEIDQNKSIDLSVLLPSYMEEENLRLLIPRIKEACTSINYEIMILDTFSPLDGTQIACNEFGVKYLPRSNGNTYGDAVRTGIAHARGKKTLFMDADGSHPPHFIANLWSQSKNGDVIVASRYVEGGTTENSNYLIWMSMIVNLGYRIILGIECKDISNSFKLYPTDQLQRLKLSCNNFDIIEEILFKLIKNNPSLKIIEVPFSFKQRMFGKTKRNLLVFVFTYLMTLIRLRFSLN